MAKTNATSAAERRKQNKNKTRKPIRGKKRNQGWLVIGTIVLALVVVVALFFLIGQQNKPTTTANKPTNTANTAILQTVTNIDPQLLNQIGTGQAQNTLKPTQGSPALLTGPTGKPMLLYVGAEFCPYCAATRWPLVIALSRFGTFHGLKQTTSSSTDVYPSTPTFSFYQSSYSSQYLDFTAVETADQQQQPLQKLTADQQKIFDTYDAPPYVDAQNAGAIPFLDFGNRFITIGANYDGGVLRTNPQDQYSQALSAQNIASQLGSNNTLSQNVLGSANYYTAAICTLTKNAPASVCNTSTIQQIEQTLK